MRDEGPPDSVVGMFIYLQSLGRQHIMMWSLFLWVSYPSIYCFCTQNFSLNSLLFNHKNWARYYTNVNPN